jgi:ribosomal protein L13
MSENKVPKKAAGKVKRDRATAELYTQRRKDRNIAKETMRQKVFAIVRDMLPKDHIGRQAMGRMVRRYKRGEFLAAKF